LLLATEVEDTLQMLRALPPGWLHPGAHVALDDVVTDLGRVRFTLKISRNGQSAVLSNAPAKVGERPPHLRVHLGVFSDAGFRSQDGSRAPDQIDIPPDRPWNLTLRRPAP
ncbi:MAG TPA: hypothetical protein VK569_11140, partial [Bacteroidota bacterium]|nr:hypothetical protein [Bacteroidota bacterium]